METLLLVRGLRKTYQRGGGVFSPGTGGARFTAVEDVSFSVNRGEVFEEKKKVEDKATV